MPYPFFVKNTGACAVCAYWGGSRQIEIRKGVIVDPSSKGICWNRRSDRHGDETPAGKASCPDCSALPDLI